MSKKPRIPAHAHTHVGAEQRAHAQTRKHAPVIAHANLSQAQQSFQQITCTCPQTARLHPAHACCRISQP